MANDHWLYTKLSASLSESFGIVMLLPILEMLSIDQTSTNVGNLNNFLIFDYIFNLGREFGLENELFIALLAAILFFLIKGLFVFLTLAYNANLRGSLSYQLRQVFFYFSMPAYLGDE